MSKQLRCHTCAENLARSDVAASITLNGWEQVWCSTCWDSPDERALNQYRALGLATDPNPLLLNPSLGPRS